MPVVSDYLRSIRQFQKMKRDMIRAACRMCQRSGCFRKGLFVCRRDGLPLNGKECQADLEVVCEAHCHPAFGRGTLPLHMPRQPSLRTDFYIKYMKSPQFRKFRQEKFASVGGICEVRGCGLPAEHIHHPTYETVGSERFEDVEALCQRHHQERHFERKGSSDRRKLYPRQDQSLLPMPLPITIRKSG